MLIKKTGIVIKKPKANTFIISFVGSGYLSDLIKNKAINSDGKRVTKKTMLIPIYPAVLIKVEEMIIIATNKIVVK